MITVPQDATRDNVSPCGHIVEAARALLAHIDAHSHRLTAETFGPESEQAKRIIEDLRDALAEVEG